MKIRNTIIVIGFLIIVFTISFFIYLKNAESKSNFKNVQTSIYKIYLRYASIKNGDDIIYKEDKWLDDKELETVFIEYFDTVIWEPGDFDKARYDIMMEIWLYSNDEDYTVIFIRKYWDSDVSYIRASDSFFYILGYSMDSKYINRIIDIIIDTILMEN